MTRLLSESHNGVSVNRRADGVCKRQSSVGNSRSCNTSPGRFSSRARCATEAASPPPELIPPTEILCSSMPRRRCVFCHPTNGSVAVVDGGRERVLRSQSVFGADYDTIDIRGEVDAARLLVVQVAEDVPSSVEEHQSSNGSDPMGRSVRSDREVIAARGPRRT